MDVVGKDSVESRKGSNVFKFIPLCLLWWCSSGELNIHVIAIGELLYGR